MQVRAVATSAVREARNGDLFLDRIRSRHGHRLRDHQRGRGEPPALPRRARPARGAHRPSRANGRSWPKSAAAAPSLTLLRRGRPNAPASMRSAPSACASNWTSSGRAPNCRSSLLKRVHRQRHRRDPRRHPARPRDAPDRRRRRRAVRGHPVAGAGRAEAARAIPPRRPPGLLRPDRIDWTTRPVADRFRLPAVEAETLVPSMLVYRALLSETARAPASSCPTRRCAAACSSTWPSPAAGSGAVDFEHQVLASADALGVKYRLRPGARPPRGAARRPGCSMRSRTNTACRARATAAAGRRDAARHRRLREPARRTTSTRSTCCRPRRSSACRTTRPPWSRTSRAITAAACRSAATCRTSRSTARTGSS